MSESQASLGRTLFGPNPARPGGPVRAKSIWRLALVAAAFLAAAALVGTLEPDGRDAPAREHAADQHGAMHMAASTGAEASRPRNTVKQISCEKLPHVPGKSLTTVLVEYPPGSFTPKHRHGGSVTAYVLKGTVRSQLNAGPLETFRPGETWFEPPGTIHTFIENASPTEPAELLAIFVADDCAVLTTFLD
jgi:quercetin dioxygenase-like cupin family protein